MLRHHTSDPNAVHWSKDFVEHLRTVHFALMAISIGLVLILSRMTSPALSQIRQIVDLKKDWPPDFPADDTKTLEYREGNILKEIHDGAKYATIRVGGPHRGKDFTLRVALPVPNWYVTPDRLRISDFPATLAGFRVWWNNLNGKTATWYFPKRIAVKSLSLGSGGGMPAEVVSFEAVAAADANSPTASAGLQSQFVANEGEDGQPYELSYQAIDVNHDASYFIKVAEAWKGTLSQTAIIKIVNSRGGKWKPGFFDESFSALSQEAGELEAEPLEDVEKALSARVTNRAEEFEAFGMKFPIAQVTLWGTVILLSVQFYFFLYLRDLSGKLAPDDPGWDIPWICMNQTFLAQVVFFTTVIVLPAAAMLLIGARASLRLTAGYWDSGHLLTPIKDWTPVVLLQIVAYVLANISTLFLGILSWRFRPQLVHVKKHCPVQLFE